VLNNRILLIVVLLVAMLGFNAVANAQDSTPVTPALGQVWHYNGAQQLMVRSATVVGNIVARLQPGSEVTVLETKNVGADIWVRHSEGWSAFKYQGATLFTFVSASSGSAGASYDSAARVARVVTLNNGGDAMEANMEASGMTFTAVTRDARQPEEETLINSAGKSIVVIVGYQVTVTNLVVAFPACFTTGNLVAGVSINYQPDPNNPSAIYTNNRVPYTGTATVYVDCSNWAGVLNATAPAVTATPTVTPNPSAQGCMSFTQLSAAGETVSLWSPDNCGPLGQ